MWKNTLLLLLLLASGAGGCQYFNPIGPLFSLGVMWYDGEAKKYYNTDQKTIDASVKFALKELEIPFTEEKTDGNTISIRAGGNGEDRFKIKIVMVKPHTTRLAIRVNIMGDKPYAEMIFRHVDNQPGVKTYNNLKVLNRDMGN